MGCSLIWQINLTTRLCVDGKSTSPPNFSSQERPDVTYHLLAVDFLPPQLLGTLLTSVAAQLAAGKIAPLRSMCYPLAAVAAALRTLAQATHVGKVVTLSPVGALAPSMAAAEGGARVVITGGLGGLGLLMGRWLVARGSVTHLLLLGRTGRLATDRGSEEAEKLLADLGSSRILVTIAAADVTFCEDSVDVWRAAPRSGRAAGSSGRIQDLDLDVGEIHAVLHASGVLSDAMIQQQSMGRVRKVGSGKGDVWSVATLCVKRVWSLQA